MSHSSKPHCSSVVTEEAQKWLCFLSHFIPIKGNAQAFNDELWSNPPFYLHQRECTAFHTLPHQRGIIIWTWPAKLQEKKTYQQFQRKNWWTLKSVPWNPTAANYYCFWTAAEGAKILQISNCFWWAAECTEICAPTIPFSTNSLNIHSPQFLYTKIKFHSPLPLHHIIKFYSFEPSTLLTKI